MDMRPNGAPGMSEQKVGSSDDRKELRDVYGRLATAGPAGASGCCGPSEGAAGAGRGGADPGGLPSLPGELSLGCGNPVGLAMLEPGQAVLDLGSGAGLDCFLAAERVGESGRVIGVDMTPGMLDRARAAQRGRGVPNVEFRLGELENLPVADDAVDVIISNCVINLVTDRPRVFREAYRVLRPGGRLVVSDMMIDAPLPEAIGAELDRRGARVCVERDYLAAVEAAGFVDIEVVDRVSPLPGKEGSEAGAPPGTRRGARVVVRIGETGESEAIDVDPASLAGLGAGPRAVLTQSVTVRARKPSDGAPGPVEPADRTLKEVDPGP